MTIISQTKAAKLAGVSRGTIANRINDGLLSATPEGIDVAELVRVFTDISGDRIEKFLAGERVPERPGTDLPEQDKTPADSAVMSDVRDNEKWLRELVEKRDEIIADKEAQLLEAQARQDERERYWQGQVNKLQALLPVPEQPKRRRFLGIF